MLALARFFRSANGCWVTSANLAVAQKQIDLWQQQVDSLDDPAVTPLSPDVFLAAFQVAGADFVINPSRHFFIKLNLKGLKFISSKTGQHTL